MTVEFTFVERLNLRALLGQWRGFTAAELRRVWSLMDRLELDEAEKAAINWRCVSRDAEEREFWDPLPENPPAPKAYDLHAADVARVRKVLAGVPWAGADRKWCARLLNTFLPDEGE
jgi:hypothetical protein